MNRFTPNSHAWFQRAQQAIPGGVNSPVRAFKGVGGDPITIARGEGPYLIDVDGYRYVDYICSWGPLILGHARPEILHALNDAAIRGLSYGAPNIYETLMAEKIIELIPSIEKVRLMSSGTEATMSAVRLARGFTGRNIIVKFDGCYHGHSDALLVRAGSGNLTLGIPGCPGIPEAVAADTLTLPYNDSEALEKLFQQRGHEIAAVITEPVVGNMNCIPPDIDFLKNLERLCKTHESLLVFDEVMTGFRVHLQGAQTLYGIHPDLTTLGKVIGGGLPVGALGGRREIMDHLAPIGPVYQAGTLSGNPIAMAVGLKTLELISVPGFYDQLFDYTSRLCTGLDNIAQSLGVPLITQHVGSMFGIFFTSLEKVKSFDDVQHCDIAAFNRFFHKMLEQGVYLGPSAYEAGFVSIAHNDETLELTLAAARRALS